jgi:hypothetical protein
MLRQVHHRERHFYKWRTPSHQLFIAWFRPSGFPPGYWDFKDPKAVLWLMCCHHIYERYVAHVNYFWSYQRPLQNPLHPTPTALAPNLPGSQQAGEHCQIPLFTGCIQTWDYASPAYSRETSS